MGGGERSGRPREGGGGQRRRKFISLRPGLPIPGRVLQFMKIGKEERGTVGIEVFVALSPQSCIFLVPELTR